jgi:sulfonate transport system substrate-binding protein
MQSIRSRARLAMTMLALSIVIGSATSAFASPREHRAKRQDQPVDLSGVTLHVADQLDSLKTVLKASGEDKNVPYEISWSSFIGGPAVIAAEVGGSVDVGFMAETPVVFAQAAGNPIKVVGASRTIDPKTSNLAIVVKPDSPITKVSQLKGKNVGIQTGTVVQYLLVKALEKAGLKYTDVQALNFPGLGGQAAFDNGDVDAAVTADPFLSNQLLEKKGRILTTGAGLTAGLQYLVARDGALGDKQLDAALADFVPRVARAYQWYAAHPTEAAAIATSTFRIPPAAALQAVKRAPTAYQPIDASIIAAQQSEADTFLALGVLQKKLDVAKAFDKRYNKLVAAVAAAKAG